MFSKKYTYTSSEFAAVVESLTVAFDLNLNDDSKYQYMIDILSHSEFLQQCADFKIEAYSLVINQLLRVSNDLSFEVASDEERILKILTQLRLQLSNVCALLANTQEVTIGLSVVPMYLAVIEYFMEAISEKVITLEDFILKFLDEFSTLVQLLNDCPEMTLSGAILSKRRMSEFLHATWNYIIFNLGDSGAKDLQLIIKLQRSLLEHLDNSAENLDQRLGLCELLVGYGELLFKEDFANSMLFFKEAIQLYTTLIKNGHHEKTKSRIQNFKERILLIDSKLEKPLTSVLDVIVPSESDVWIATKVTQQNEINPKLLNLPVDNDESMLPKIKKRIEEVCKRYLPDDQIQEKVKIVVDRVLVLDECAKIINFYYGIARKIENDFPDTFPSQSTYAKLVTKDVVSLNSPPPVEKSAEQLTNSTSDKKSNLTGMIDWIDVTDFPVPSYTYEELKSKPASELKRLREEMVQQREALEKKRKLLDEVMKQQNVIVGLDNERDRLFQMNV